MLVLLTTTGAGSITAEAGSTTGEADTLLFAEVGDAGVGIELGAYPPTPMVVPVGTFIAVGIFLFDEMVASKQ